MRKHAILVGLIVILLLSLFTANVFAQGDNQPVIWVINESGLNEASTSQPKEYYVIFGALNPPSNSTLETRWASAFTEEEMVKIIQFFGTNSAAELVGKTFTGAVGETEPDAILRQLTGTGRPRLARPQSESELRAKIARSLINGQCPSFADYGQEVLEQRLRTVHQQILDPQTPWFKSLINEVRQGSGGKVQIMPLPYREMRREGPVRFTITYPEYGDQRMEIIIDPPLFRCRLMN